MPRPQQFLCLLPPTAPDSWEAYAHEVLGDLASLRRYVMDTEIDDDLLEVDKPLIPANLICEEDRQDIGGLTALCGFAPAEFNQLKDRREAATKIHKDVRMWKMKCMSRIERRHRYFGVHFFRAIF
jgi:hypothetical protein